MILIALLVGNFTFAQQKALTEKEKLLIEKGQIKMPVASADTRTFTKAPAPAISLNRFVRNENKGSAYAIKIDVSSGINSVVSFDLDAPGTLNTIADLSLTGDNFICAASWADNTWYVSEYGANTLGTIDPSDGTYTVIGSFGVGINALAYDNSTNTMYGAGYDGTTYSLLYTINLATGAATLIGTAEAGVIIGLACNTSGTLYAADIVDNNLYSIDKTTGAATVVGTLGIDIAYAQDLEYDNENDVLYLAGYTSLASLYIVNPATGAATLVGDFPSSTEMCGLAIPYNAVTYTNDIALQSISSPVTGPNLTATEPVTVRVKNNGTVTQSNIDVSYTVNGGTAVNEVIAGPIAAGNYVDYIFTQTADLSVVQSYEIIATAIISGDENPNNNSKTKTVINQGNLILMQNGTFSSCSGTFYDTGGPDGTYQSSENITMTIAPSTPGAKMHFNFTAFECENTYDFLKVYDGADVNAPLIGNFTGVTIPAELVELQASAANASGAITFNFTSDGSVVKTGWAATVSCYIPTTHDMAANAVSGNTTPTSGTSTDYIVSVTNEGTSAELGSDYTVALYDEHDALISSVSGVDIVVGEQKTFTFSWTPGTPGVSYLYGKVVLTGDGNAANDQTPNFNVDVQPTGIIVVTIGTGTELPSSPKTPFDFYWKNSMAESLYFPDEIGQPAGSQITQIAYHNNFTSNITSTPVKIFMGETNVNDLTGGWISANDLTAVFDGTVEFPAGINDIIITLTTPYIYNGGNLVIMSNRPMDTQYYLSTDKFYSTISATHPARTLAVYDDNILFNPYAPPSGTATKDYFPNTMLYMVRIEPIYTSDFETFTAGGQVACQDPVNWTTWSNAPCGAEDAYVSTDFAHSGVNSVKDNGSNDLVLPMGNKTTGEYKFEFWMYVPAGHGGYYNLLHDFAGGSSEWGLEFLFTDAGTANLMAGGVTTPVAYMHDQWFKVTNIIDLNNDLAEVFLDDVSVFSWKWSLDPTTGDPGLNQLSAADFYSGSGAPGIVSPLYYFDDMVYEEAAPNGFDATFTVSNATPAVLEGAAIQVKKGGLIFNGITDASGMYKFVDLPAGSYDYTVSLDGFITQTGNFSGDATNIAVNVTLMEDMIVPFGLAVTNDGVDAVFSWNNSTGLDSFSDSFEDGTFDAWSDFIQGPGTPGDDDMAYWNPQAPDGGIAPDGVMCAHADWGYGIDTWLISPTIAITPTTTCNFQFNTSYYWMVDPNPNGDIFVKVSTDDGATWTTIWREEDFGTFTNWEWNAVSLNLSSYAGQGIKVAFNLVANDDAAVEIDAVNITSTVMSKAFIGYNVYLDNLTTPVATNVSATTYTFLAPAQGAHTAGVSATYTTGTTPIVTIDWTFYVGIDPVANSNINIYPNPTKGRINIDNISNANIYITDIMGNVIAGKENVKGSSGFDLSGFASGIYLVKIVSDNKVITRKVNVID